MSGGKMEMFSFVTNCLLTFNYPLAHSMSDEELAEVFKTSNRCFLISWMLKLLDSAYEEALEDSENDKELLGNFVYELGFCTQKEKLPFMTGNLPVGQQVNILSNMFNFIIDIKKCDIEKNKTRVTNDEIIALNNTNLNLFPMYGDIRLANTDTFLKWAEFDKELNEIKALVLEKKENGTKDLTEYKFNDAIELFLQEMKEELPNIKFVLENICKNKDTKCRGAIKLQPNSAEILKKCGDNIRIISQFIKDMKTIEDIRKNHTEFSINADGGEKFESYLEMLNILYEETLTISKSIRCL